MKGFRRFSKKFVQTENAIIDGSIIALGGEKGILTAARSLRSAAKKFTWSSLSENLARNLSESLVKGMEKN